MFSLTGNVDTDAIIMSSLSLDDVRRICQINQYAANLCTNHLKSKFKYVKNKVTHVMNLIDSKVNGVLVQPDNEYETFATFHDLMNTLNITEPTFNEFEEHPSMVYNTFVVIYLRCIPDDINYQIVYGLTAEVDVYTESDITTFYGNKKQLIELLTQLYYNELILIL